MTSDLPGISPSRESRFDWPLCYAAENLVLEQIQAFLNRNPAAAALSQRMQNETGTLMIDWVDHLIVSPDRESALMEAGFTHDPLGQTAMRSQRTFWHPEAMLPRIIVDDASPGLDHPHSLAIRVESLGDFIDIHKITNEPIGEPLTRFRRVLVSAANGTRFEAIERRGYRGYVVGEENSPGAEGYLEAVHLWRTRRRIFADDADGFKEANSILDQMIVLIGRDLACHVVFVEERAFWENHNRAAQVQKRRQDALGLGWANHDHHTFRSSRQHFVDLMGILDKLGFERRERYYAGAQAGWGAQISEQPVEGIVTFCDVDLQPDETDIDFSRHGLGPQTKLGTIGLWVGLHGESILDAGMHHLECRFDHELARDQMAREGVATMKPFSDLPFLKQAFTEGEKWPVRRERAERLLQAGFIDARQFEQFLITGAIGSHLENLQRRGGFKGFNQKSVSVIIEATDPRKQQH